MMSNGYSYIMETRLMQVFWAEKKNGQENGKKSATKSG